MIFSTVSFSIFFILLMIILILIQLCCKNRISQYSKISHVVLLIASYIYCGWYNVIFAVLLAVMSAITFICAITYEHSGRKLFVHIGVIVPLIILGIFKYSNFFISAINTFGLDFNTINLILPLGISFYTFQAIGYIIDVYRKNIKAEHSVLTFALYMAFFPKLLAGPIVRSTDFLPQIRNGRRISLRGISAGMQIFLFGLMKKVVLADHLSVFVNDVFNNPAEFSWFSIVLAVISYALQIYLDFSGYSDMAIGCAGMLGFDFKRNFNLPYLSHNVTEFWKRWHISLSEWFQQYLYIPLGGNRTTYIHMLANLMTTMLLVGFWHGAAWTFVVWGGLHGMAVCMHKIFRKYYKNRNGNALGRGISILFTDVFVTLCWILFRADTFGNAGQILIRMMTLQSGVNELYTWTFISITAVAAATVCAVIRSGRRGEAQVNGFYPLLGMRKFSSMVIVAFEVLLIIGLAYTENNPFIYLQF